MSNAPYKVTLTRSAQKEVRSLDVGARVRVIRAVRELAAAPRSAGCRKLVNSDDRWRIRVGDYRVIYTIDDAGRLLEVVAVRHRGKAYE
ncbi:MAG TPA: type II toxin-antitoxin system RelE/ParE family toxin [Pyrinomonadaceae bacterium]|jgi:mRNA interferase RelE/StbE